MFQSFELLNLFFVFLVQIRISTASPVQRVPRDSHPCTVFVQRWYDSSLDIYDYGYAWSPTNQVYTNIGFVESANGLSPGQSIPSTIGSHELVTTDVANPAVVNGNVNWDDPGKLSFVWGTESWDSYSANSPCNVSAVGSAGALQGLPTTTTCFFTCDS